MSVALKAGGNLVAYTGQAQTVEDAFASIMPYFEPVYIIYYWNNVGGWYEEVTPAIVPGTLMVPYGVYWIEVTQDCTWTYGPDETPPTFVYLYSEHPNQVPYCGPEQPAEDAFSSILNYLSLAYYRDNRTKRWVQVLRDHIMVLNGVYAVYVTQNCVWTFEVEVPEPAGTITRKELDYQNIWQALPVYNIPAGTRTRVRTWGRNDTSINQKMGIYWFVADPEGYVVQEHYDWETFWTGPGLEQGFVGSGFDLSKVGKYTIWVELLMNPDDPQVVDRYIGDLCTVAAVVPEPEFRNFALSEYTK